MQDAPLKAFGSIYESPPPQGFCSLGIHILYADEMNTFGYESNWGLHIYRLGLMGLVLGHS